MREFHIRRAASLAVVSAVLAACAVGPDHVRPEVPVSARFARDVAVGGGDPGAVPVATPEADAEFWATFDDPTLTRLVDAALLVFGRVRRNVEAQRADALAKRVGSHSCWGIRHPHLI